jgi:hypothetical protein
MPRDLFGRPIQPECSAYFSWGNDGLGCILPPGHEGDHRTVIEGVWAKDYHESPPRRFEISWKEKTDAP